jgi:hypothetical protein
MHGHNNVVVGKPITVAGLQQEWCKGKDDAREGRRYIQEYFTEENGRSSMMTQVQ